MVFGARLERFHIRIFEKKSVQSMTYFLLFGGVGGLTISIKFDFQRISLCFKKQKKKKKKN